MSLCSGVGVQATESPLMIHCIHYLKNALHWVPSDSSHDITFPTCSGCSTTGCALRNNGATKYPVNSETLSNKCKKLHDQDVVLLVNLQSSQCYDWRSDLAYESDFMIKRLRNQVRNALIRLEGKSVEETSSPISNASTIDDNGETGSGLDIENLRVKIDISNSLRAHIDAENFPPIPPRVGPSTLPRSVGLADLVDLEEDEEPSDNSKTAGKKHHCIHCLEHSAWWVPSDAMESDDVEPYGCSVTICALRGKDGSKGCYQCDESNSWEPLPKKQVQLLETFHLHQLCDWKSDTAFLNDSLIVDFHHKIKQAYAQLKGTATARHAGATASAAATTTTNGNVASNGDIALQVQMDISDCLREILETLQRRGSSDGTIPADPEVE
ncbi:hypothetical protein FCOIX_6240 [Fusarium coicis]|nr:hypothetical protein FCOIX_6240 [Fusarium coicis]